MKFPRFFVHPWPASALLLLALNDHHFKYAYPGWWSGKISDFCGLFFFPLFLCALFYFCTRFTWRLLFLCVGLTDLVFVLIKVFPAATQVYVDILGACGFPSRAVTDPSDLIALGVNLALYFHARRFIEAW